MSKLLDIVVRNLINGNLEAFPDQEAVRARIRGLFTSHDNFHI